MVTTPPAPQTPQAYTCPFPSWCTIDHATEDRAGEHVCDSGDQPLCADETGRPVTGALLHFVYDTDAVDSLGLVPTGTAGTYVSLRVEDGPTSQHVVVHRDQLRTLIARLEDLERQLG